MKAVFAFTCVVLLGVSAHHLSSEEKLKLKTTYDICQANKFTHVDEDILTNLPENIDNINVINHLFCMSVNVRMQKANGDLDKDVIRRKIALVTHDQSKVDGLVEKCAVVQDTPEKTATMLWLCFLKNDIHYALEL